MAVDGCADDTERRGLGGLGAWGPAQSPPLCTIHSFIHSYSFNVQVDITQLQTEKQERKTEYLYM